MICIYEKKIVTVLILMAIFGILCCSCSDNNRKPAVTTKEVVLQATQDTKMPPPTIQKNTATLARPPLTSTPTASVPRETGGPSVPTAAPKTAIETSTPKTAAVTNTPIVTSKPTNKPETPPPTAKPTPILTEAAAAAALKNTKYDFINNELFAVCDQKNSCVSIYSLALNDFNSPDAILWKFEIASSHFQSGYAAVADTKLRWSEQYHSYVVLIATSKYACEVSYPEGKLLWETENIGQNGHAIEMLPNGNIAVASSSGNTIRIFNASQGKSGTSYSAVTLEDAHGVLWDPSLNILWGIGKTALCAYEIKGTASSPQLAEVVSMRVTLPKAGGHDLFPVYGDSGNLWITGKNVYQFNKSQKMFTTNYAGSAVLNKASTKSIGNFPNSKTVLRVIPNKTFQTWNTNVIGKITFEGGKTILTEILIDTGAYYKVRIFNSQYQ